MYKFLTCILVALFGGAFALPGQMPGAIPASAPLVKLELHTPEAPFLNPDTAPLQAPVQTETFAPTRVEDSITPVRQTTSTPVSVSGELEPWLTSAHLGRSYRKNSATEITSTPAAARATRDPTNPLDLQTFAASVKNGDAGRLVAVYVPGILALRVLQQQAENSAYVYPVAGYATQFKLAARFGTTALLAHNYLSGAQFFRLKLGETANLIYGDGTIRRYTISSFLRFQAITPEDPFSKFVDLDGGGTLLTSDGLFRRIYMDAGTVVFQTCISANGNASWGRLFVTALPR